MYTIIRYYAVRRALLYDVPYATYDVHNTIVRVQRILPRRTQNHTHTHARTRAREETRIHNHIRKYTREYICRHSYTHNHTPTHLHTYIRVPPSHTLSIHYTFHTGHHVLYILRTYACVCVCVRLSACVYAYVRTTRVSYYVI